MCIRDSASLWLLSESEKIEFFMILPGLEISSMLTPRDDYPILILKFPQEDVYKRQTISCRLFWNSIGLIEIFMVCIDDLFVDSYDFNAKNQY